MKMNTFPTKKAKNNEYGAKRDWLWNLYFGKKAFRNSMKLSLLFFKLCIKQGIWKKIQKAEILIESGFNCKHSLYASEDLFAKKLFFVFQ